MPPTISSLEPQIRQACEPCRRKKTKCTAERPTCSYCKRLKIQCSYMPRGRSRPHHVRESTKPTRARERRREASNLDHTSGFMGSSDTAVNPIVDTTISTDTLLDTSGGMASAKISSPASISQHIPGTFICPPSRLDEPRRFSLARPEPSPEALEHFAEVYRLKLHLQPLPLLSINNLAHKLITGSQFLLWAFMALIMDFSTHEFYEGQELAAINFYVRSAEEASMRLAFGGVPTTEITQALCLVALKHIKNTEAQRLAQAWMVVGAASRLQALGALSDPSSPASDGDSISRAHWSVFALERMFIPCMSDIPGIRVPEYPPSAPLPTPPLSIKGGDARSNVSGIGVSTRSGLRDIGIIGHSLRIIDIWGKVRCYLHRLRQGMVEKPWSSESSHMRLCGELIEYEAQLNTQYFLCNASLPSWTATEVSESREYWNPWITSQLLWHACHAILNHPFLHTFLLRSPEGIPPSCLFLQQRVDLAIYHTGWLFRILDACRSLTELIDPLIGDAIAAASTALWLFQFSKDVKVSKRAQEDLTTCDACLSHVAQTWPHISQKVNTLRKLQSLAEEIRQQISDRDTTINFQPVWFWELLDPKICNSTKNGSRDFTHTFAEGLGHSKESRISLRSHFVMPLDENEHIDQGRPSSDSYINTGDSLLVMPDELELFDIDSLSFDFLHNGLWEPGP